MNNLPIHIKIINTLLRLRQSNNKPILILGHGRSGTTWIGDTLAQAENTLLYHEPCNPYLPTGSPLSKLWFTYIRPNDEHAYFEERLNSAYHGLIDMHSSIWFRDKQKLFTRLNPKHRTIIKEVASVMNIEWLALNYPSDLLFVLRHPCSVALSEYERNIDGKRSLQYLLENKNLSNLLNEEEKKLINKAKEPFEYFGLIWSIRNKPFSIRHKMNKEIAHIQYEKLASNPIQEFEKIFTLFNLKWTQNIETYILENTTSETKGYYKTTKNAQEHIDRWKTTLSNEQVDQVKQFTLPFNLGFYEENHFKLN